VGERGRGVDDCYVLDNSHSTRLTSVAFYTHFGFGLYVTATLVGRLVDRTWNLYQWLIGFSLKWPVFGGSVVLGHPRRGLFFGGRLCEISGQETRWLPGSRVPGGLLAR
jgi:hypothetical protein